MRLLAEGHESRYVAASRSWKTRALTSIFFYVWFFFLYLKYFINTFGYFGIKVAS